MLKKIYLVIAIVLCAVITQAQVTTSSITGTVLDENNKPLEGATISILHVPTGAKTETLSRKGGGFDLQGLVVGGPYTVSISYVGLAAQKIEDVKLVLGEAFNLKINLSPSTTALETVVVSGVRGKGINAVKTGAGTTISRTLLSTAPTISRSLNDFVRLTPQSNGTSFAGRDGRYNNLQIDGANLNNNFGLSSDLAPGGGSPVSLDALEEISVNIAPFDVRQSGFTGAGINVVTKSGTNQFHGSMYGYIRNKNFYGNNVNGFKLTKTDNSNSVTGINIGGPIVKNKLFFFTNWESEKSSSPGISFTPKGSSFTGSPSSTATTDLKKVSDFVKQKYGYDLGAYENFPNFEENNRKFLAKLDWIISSKHKLTVKYTDYKGFSASPLNNSSVPQSGTIFVTGQTNGVTRLPNNRFSANSMAFNSSNYGTDRLVKSGTFELNSRFTNQISNQFLVTFTRSSDIRKPIGGAVFPTVDIFNGTGQNFISLGTDPFTNNNELVNDIFSITDNVTYYVHKHKITGGFTVEKQKVGNMFMGGSNGHYAFNSLDDFLQEKAPAYYGYTYSLVEGKPAVFSAELKMTQVGVYLQDEFNATDKLKLTYGIRADLPIYGESPIANPKISELQFPDRNGNMTNFSTGAWPKNKVLFSPRIGFNYDALANKTLIIRGGTGIFSGRIPFVFLTNMPSNSGMYQNAVFLNSAAQLADAGITKFDPNPDAYANSSAFPKVAGQKVPQNFVLIDPNFKFPQVWRSNIGSDYKFGDGFTATIDAMFTKDLNAVVMRNPNLKAPTATFTGEDNRNYYPGGTRDLSGNQLNTTVNYYLNSLVGTPIILENTKKGHSFNITGQLSKSFASGLYTSVAYTYSQAKEVSPNPGSRATSAWQSILNVNGPNNQVLDFSQYAIPHRIIGTISYRTEHGLFDFPSIFSLFYEGAHQGLLNYTINGSIVGDGNSALMYVYSKGADVPFVATSKYSVAQQQQAYDDFINSNKYLSKRKGQYVNRYGATSPWFNQIDFKYIQDVLVRRNEKGAVAKSLQLSVDIFNLGNMINPKWDSWGYKEVTTLTDPLAYKGVVNGTPTFNMREFNGSLVSNPYQQLNTTSSTWKLQLGLKFNF